MTRRRGDAEDYTRAEAVQHILGLTGEGRAKWIGSAVPAVEISRNPDPDPDRRRDAERLLEAAAEGGRFPWPPQSDGLRTLERLDSAPLTRFTWHLGIRRAHKHSRVLRVRVANPVFWYREFGK